MELEEGFRRSIDICSFVQYTVHMAATAAKIANVLSHLREDARLRETVPREDRRLSSGVSSLDVALQGGLPRGRVLELSGPRSSGRLSMAVQLLSAAAARGEWTALIDVSDAFDPRSASLLMMDRLLWVRPRMTFDGFKVADLILDAGGFGLVVLYLCEHPQRERLDWTALALRLKHRAERSQAAVLLVTDVPRAGSVALAGRIHTRSGAYRWRGGLLEKRESEITVEIKHAVSEVPLAFDLSE